MKKLSAITIIRDSREKQDEGWFWQPEIKQAGKIQILETKVQVLDAADYAIEGFESICRIERKAGFGELFNNIVNKESKERFERELEKLREIKHKYLLIECNISKDILGFSIPQYKFPVPINRILKTLNEYELEYNLHVQFVADAGKRIAKNIFENIARKYL